MAKGFKQGAGGGNPLNFRVVGGTAEPANPKENTLWVNTDQKITSWIFSPAEPTEPSEGMVWFPLDTDDTNEFNALKKNGIALAPKSAKQYAAGKWGSKAAEKYTQGQWSALAKVPQEYQEVEYLQSSGTQYIWTPVSGKLYQMRVEYGFNRTSGVLFGTNKVSPYFILGGGGAIGATNGGVQSGTNLSNGEDHFVEIYGDSAGSMTAKADGATLTAYSIGSSNAGKVYNANSIPLFGCATSPEGIYNLYTGKLYDFRVYDTDHKTLLFEFIPCYRKTDSVAGVYETVSKKFYTNNGSGTFIVGGDV